VGSRSRCSTPRWGARCTRRSRPASHTRPSR
jgi:hypothetical protein